MDIDVDVGVDIDADIDTGFGSLHTQIDIIFMDCAWTQHRLFFI